MLQYCGLIKKNTIEPLQQKTCQRQVLKKKIFSILRPLGPNWRFAAKLLISNLWGAITVLSDLLLIDCKKIMKTASVNCTKVSYDVLAAIQCLECTCTIYFLACLWNYIYHCLNLVLGELALVVTIWQVAELVVRRSQFAIRQRRSTGYSQSHSQLRDAEYWLQRWCCRCRGYESPCLVVALICYAFAVW